MTEVRLNRVSARRGRRVVLRDVTTVFRGHTVVSGANGVGKSTLLRVVAGPLVPFRGTIARPRAAVGYLPERFCPPGELRLGAYLEHMARIKANDVRRLSAAFGLDGVLDQRIRTLSKGTVQKVGLVQALLGDPDVLVLDEPRSGLDVAARLLLDEALAAAARRGAVVVTAEHDAVDGAVILTWAR